MTPGLQTALALSTVALASIYLGWKAVRLARAFLSAAKGRGGAACGGCGTARRNGRTTVELVRFPPRTTASQENPQEKRSAPR